MKKGLCVNFGLGVSLLLGCFLVVSVSGSSESQTESDQSKISEEGQDSSASLEMLGALSKYFKALEQKNRDQDKIIEELTKRFESSQKNCDEEIKSLSKKVDDFKSEISEDHGVSFLMPPLRGPPGKQGERGEKGEPGGKGEKGDQGPIGPPGREGEKGPPGQQGATGPKGERGLAGCPSSGCLKNCGEIQKAASVSGFQVHNIYPFGPSSSAVKVLCDFETDGGGWTVIQKREKGPKEEFYRNWTDYAGGFYGSESEGASGNYWIGLDIIHALTNKPSSLTNQSLRVDLTDWNDKSVFAQYSSFSVGDSRTNYTLNVGGYWANSSAGDSLKRHNGMQFSTKDRDNDEYGGSCAQTYKGAWWYQSCWDSNLNGLYFNPAVDTSSGSGIAWNVYQKTTSMKIRDADFTKSLSFG